MFETNQNPCTTTDFTPMEVYSIFDYYEDDIIYYKAGALGYTGRVKFKVDSSRDDYDTELLKFDTTELDFEFIVWMPSCTSPSMAPSMAPSISTMPSMIPSTIPSSTPSISAQPSSIPSIEPSSTPTVEQATICIAKDVVGRTFITRGADNYCYHVEMFDGGIFKRDNSANDCDTSDFTDTSELGIFDRVEGNQIFFKEGSLGYTGHFNLIEDKHIDDAMLSNDSWDSSSLTFVIDLILQTCDVPSVSFAIGFEHSCVLKLHNSLSCWGNNEYGQLGDGSTVSSNTPVQVSGIDPEEVFQIIAGYRHTCAVMFDRSILCWGWNAHGQVGDGTTTTTPSPIEIFASEEVKDAATGAFHTCVIKFGKSLYCWGNNAFGQIGDGSTTSRNTPVLIDQMSGSVQQISVGYTHTCAVLTDKRIKCWGQNNHGQVGLLCRQEFCSEPVYVPDLYDAVKVTTGVSHSCALLTDATVRCWGLNSNGQLGDQSTASSSVPETVHELQGVHKLTSGNFHNCALLENDSVKCWGSNLVGQGGDGSTKSRNVPISASTLDTFFVTQIASSSVAYRNLAMLDGLTITCWGADEEDKCYVPDIM